MTDIKRDPNRVKRYFDHPELEDTFEDLRHAIRQIGPHDVKGNEQIQKLVRAFQRFESSVYTNSPRAIHNQRQDDWTKFNLALEQHPHCKEMWEELLVMLRLTDTNAKGESEW